MTKIKICGIRRMEDIDYVNTCKPDYIGFVFAESKRKVTRNEAERLRGRLNDVIVPVGVFVNEEPERVAELLNCGMIQMAQLHGDEDEAYLLRLRSKMKQGALIKAIRVSKPEDIHKAYFKNADYLLFDTYCANAYGGTGKTFPWEFLKDVSKPFFLAGGLHNGNLKEAIVQTKPYCVDISSAVEVDGFKNREKMIELMEIFHKTNEMERN